MYDEIPNMIENIEKTGADEIKYTYEFEKDENVYIFTCILRKRGENCDHND